MNKIQQYYQECGTTTKVKCPTSSCIIIISPDLQLWLTLPSTGIGLLINFQNFYLKTLLNHTNLQHDVKIFSGSYFVNQLDR